MGDKIRYMENQMSISLKGELRRNYHLVHVDNLEALTFILNQAQGGKTSNQLSHELQNQYSSITGQEAIQFINDLISNQLLISELEITLTDGDLLEKLSVIFSSNPALLPWKLWIESLIEEIKALDNPASPEISQEPDFSKFQNYRSLKNELQNPPLAHRLAGGYSHGLQIDVARKGNFTLPASLLENIKTAIELLNATAFPAYSTLLQEFTRQFYQKYEWATVSLTEALDPETGIRFGNTKTEYSITPLLDGLIFGKRKEEDNIHHPSIKPEWQSFLLSKYIECLKNGQSTMEISEEEANSFSKEYPLHTISAFPYLVASFIAKQDDSYLIHLQGLGGVSVASVLARFAHLDSDLESGLHELLQTESAFYAGKILAEVIHLNQPKTGNITTRPMLRPYEIPIYTPPSKNATAIYLSDLYLKIDRKNPERLILFSKQHNKEILPRLASAHNYTLESSPLYKFLCEYQYQGISKGCYWNWGMLSGQSFLPRVTFKNIILSKAQWQIEAGILKEILPLSGNDLVEKVSNLKERFNISRHVLITQGDNQLPIDLENEWSLEILKSCIKELPITFQENLFINENTQTQDFSNEIIIPLHIQPSQTSINKSFVKEDTISYKVKDKGIINGTSTGKEPVYFIPGSEWLYAKIYCSMESANRILSEIIKPVVTNPEHHIDNWFFVRYADPDFHIRVRFKGKGLFYQELIKHLNQYCQTALQNKMISSIQYDTYKPEWERYGEENMLDSELIFHYDSIAMMLLSEQVAQNEKIYSYAAFLSVDRLLDDAGLDLNTKYGFVKNISESFKNEWGNTGSLKESLSKKYRYEKNELEQLLQFNSPPPSKDNNNLTKIFNIFSERSNQIKPLFERIHHRYNEQNVSVSFHDLLSSLIHMSLNRIFVNQSRKQETVIYDFLYQYYRSLVGRNK
jgi:thiopeptide-type bacteriocin biosynthesis protein